MSCQPAVDACDPVSLRPCVPADLPFLQRLYASTRAAEVQASGWPAAAAEAFLLWRGVRPLTRPVLQMLREQLAAEAASAAKGAA